VLLTESVIEALTAIERGLTDCMPCYGTHGLSADHLKLFERSGVRRFALAFGGNEASRLEMEKFAAQLREQGFGVATVTLPAGEDINSYLTGSHADEAKTAFQVKVGEAFASIASPQHSHAGSAVVVPGELFEPTAHGFKLSLHGRIYEVKGIARETTQLKVTIKASGDPAKGFELTTLDLYSSRSRDAYTKACMALFGEPDTVIKADMARVLERVESWQRECSAEVAVPAAAPEDAARAVAFLTNPDLFGEILADLHTLGLAGEEMNKLLCYLACVSRKLDDPLSLLIQSRSAAGKSATKGVSIN
jgi:hypothetical protein